MSTALARGMARLGIGSGLVVAVLCRDHRGRILAMAACGKLGARLVLMNTGLAKPQFADVCERENVKAVLYDSEFTDLLDAPSSVSIRDIAAVTSRPAAAARGSPRLAGGYAKATPSWSSASTGWVATPPR
jgi:fatty-acyl-CoA synthase